MDVNILKLIIVFHILYVDEISIMIIHFCHKFRNDLGNKIKHELRHL